MLRAKFDGSNFTVCRSAVRGIMLRHGRGREFIVSCLIYWHFMGFWGRAAVASLDFGTIYVDLNEFRNNSN